MGLDLVELVFGVEDAFGIFIPDSDAEKLRTPGILIDYLERRLQAGESTLCLSQRAFYLLRKEAMKEFNAPRTAVRPETEWTSLLPRSRRGEAWNRIGGQLGITKWPALERPRPITLGAASLVAAVAVIGMTSNPLVAILDGAGAGWIASKLTKPYALNVPASVRTVGETAKYLATHAPSALQRDSPQWTPVEIQNTVHRLIEYHLGIKEFRMDQEFTRDLGAG